MEEIAEVYGRSLFAVAQEHGKLDDVREQLGQFAEALQDNRDLAVFFFSPYFSTPEKKDGLQKTVTDADPTLINFLELLIEKHRMPAIFRIRRYTTGCGSRRTRSCPSRSRQRRRSTRRPSSRSAIASPRTPARRSSSPRTWTPTSSAASSCGWATRSSTPRFATASTT